MLAVSVSVPAFWLSQPGTNWSGPFFSAPPPLPDERANVEKYRERIARLLRFASTANENDEQSVSLEQYVARLKEGQSVRVKVLEADDKGRLRLSMKAAAEVSAKPAGVPGGPGAITPSAPSSPPPPAK